MGKGDKKTKKGKIITGSYGVSRKRKKSTPIVPSAKKETESKSKKETTVKEKKSTTAKKSTAKKPAAKKASK